MKEVTASALDRVSDETLVARSKQGDSAATEQLLDKYRSVVLHKSRRYFLQCADRDDMVQEGMIGLFKATRDYRQDRDCSFRTFADLCITRQMITAVKASTGQRQLPLTYAYSLDSLAPGITRDDRHDIIADASAQDPEELLIASETMYELRALLREKLSEFEWRVFVRFRQGKSYQEIAEALNCSPKSIDNALCRVRKKSKTKTKVIEEAQAPRQQAVDGLPERWRKAVGFKNLGMSYRKIGKRIGVSVRTVHTYITRAEQRLQAGS